MALPASLLQQIERHPCFSGCYSHEWEANICLDPARAVQPAFMVSCKDCLSFKLGVLKSLLPSGATYQSLADEMTQHMRKLRGFNMSLSGYHTAGPGFWLSVAGYPSGGLFIIDGERSRSLGTDLDLLILAFRQGVLKPADPRMLDPKMYQTQAVHINFGGPISAVTSKQDFLTSPQCRVQATQGFKKATLAEFTPLAAQPAKPGAQAAKPAPKVLKPGDICPVCKAEFRLRPLLHGTYMGCLC